jgi:hypothetical protein
VLQEIALARLVTLIVGDIVIHWTSQVVSTLLGLCSALDIEAPSVLRWLPASRPEDEELLDVLHRSRNCSATDQRDKVYACLGMVSQQVAKSVPVNYAAQDPLDVYIEVAIYLVMVQNRLDVLLHTMCQPLTIDTAPSWVPRWDVKSAYDLFPPQFNSKKTDVLAASWFSRVDTDGRLPLAEMERLKHQRSVYGHVDFRVDICERNAPPQPNLIPNSAKSVPRAFSLPCLRVRAHLLDTVVKLMPKLTSQRTFILPRTYAPAFGTLCSCELCLTQDGFRSHPPDPKDAGSHSDSASPQDSWLNDRWLNDQHREHFKSMARQFGLSKTPFNTVQSMGFGNRVVVGDTIWALSGLNVPVILRKVDGHYVLMGECYLHGATLDHPCGYCGRGVAPWSMVTEVIDIW